MKVLITGGLGYVGLGISPVLLNFDTLISEKGMNKGIGRLREK